MSGVNLPKAQQLAKELVDQPLAEVAGDEYTDAFIKRIAPKRAATADLDQFINDHDNYDHDRLVPLTNLDLKNYKVVDLLGACIGMVFETIPLVDVRELREVDPQTLENILHRDQHAKIVLNLAWALDDLAHGKNPPAKNLRSGIKFLLDLTTQLRNSYQEAQAAHPDPDRLAREYLHMRANFIVSACQGDEPVPTYIPADLVERIKSEDFRSDKEAQRQLLKLITKNEPMNEKRSEEVREVLLIPYKAGDELANMLRPVTKKIHEISRTAGAFPGHRRHDGPG